MSEQPRLHERALLARSDRIAITTDAERAADDQAEVNDEEEPGRQRVAVARLESERHEQRERADRDDVETMLVTADDDVHHRVHRDERRREHERSERARGESERDAADWRDDGAAPR